MNIAVKCDLPGYCITEQIYAGTKTLVYRGIREFDQHLVVIKLLRNEYPSFSELVQFRNQYTIAKNLHSFGIIKPYSLELYGNSYALVMEDFGGVSLSKYARGQKSGFDVERSAIAQPNGDREQKTRRDSESSMIHDPLTIADFLAIALQLCDILSELYHHRIIHKDIKPANILINPETKQVKLIDFSIASLLPRETQDIQNPNGLEGTLAYLSPEQTGRMNRGIDYRSDYYSLGATFFELLTGQLPFHSNDPMELVHCHIAKQPPACRYLNPTVPPVLSAIVSKLLAKNAEDRYQSALGLKHDLEQCLTQWQKADSITAFTLGQRDITDRFLIPEKLYGREQEVAALLSAFERVSGSIGSELILVAGFSGIGKTAIVNEVHKPIVRQRGYFIKGKYDQFQRDIPFSAFVQAFRDLMGQLLSESDLQLEGWKTKILTAVGESGQVLIEVIPELERIIGTQPIVPDLSGSAAQSRFNLLMQKFVQVFTTQKHPLVLFLDDLQWADLASLKLLRVLMQETEHLLVIGAYRNNEVSAAHPFMLTIAEMAKTGVTMSEIALQALSQDHLNQLIADALSCERAIAQPLTELVYQKTNGNPFFTTQFLKALYEDGQITFDWKTRYWQCDIAVVKSVAITDDVVEFMALQLQKLPAETQEILKLAACIGNQFDLATLAIVSQQSLEAAAAALWGALKDGLIIPTTETYKFFTQANETAIAAPFANPAYKFLHDRVQQAAYTLIQDNQKQATHLKIGHQLLRNSNPIEREERLFEIVNQLNIGKALISNPIEQLELAQLNLNAGLKAKTSTAYTTAANYLKTGIELLGAESWQHAYDLTLMLHRHLADIEFLCGNFATSTALVDLIVSYATNVMEQAEVYNLLVVQHTFLGNYTAAIEVGIKALNLLEMDIPSDDLGLKAAIQQEIQTINDHLKHRSILSLLDELSETSDRKIRIAVQLLVNLDPPVYITSNLDLYILISAKIVALSLDYGYIPETVKGYGNYGWLSGIVLGDYKSGYDFGVLGMSLARKLNDRAQLSKVSLSFGSWINNWSKPVWEVLNVNDEGYLAGLESGEILFGGWNLFCKVTNRLFGGTSLDIIDEDLQKFLPFANKTKNGFLYGVLGGIYFLMQGLIESADAPVKAESGIQIDRQQYLEFCETAQDFCSLTVYYIWQMQLACINQTFSEGLSYALAAKRTLQGALGFTPVSEYPVYESLILLNLYNDATPEQQAEYLQQVQNNQTQYKVWAENCPENFLHKYLLVEAERHRVIGETLQAVELYDRAIASAKENHFTHIEAIANELAACFYLTWGKERIVQEYMIAAYYAYSRWGAKAKVSDLEQRYPELLAPILQQRQQLLTTTETIIAASSHASKTSTSSSASETLDLAAVLKVSQTLSSEIELDKLVFALLEVVVESAGAQKCALMLLQDDCLMLIAVNSAESCPMTLHHVPVEESQEVPISLINRVKRTLEPIVIMDAIHHPSLASDLYIQRHQSRSVLCTPIIHQSKLLGILYLENNLVTGAFTSDRVELLNLLCAQAAISLENARLYQQSQQMLAELSVTKARFQRLADNVPGIIYQVRLAPDGSVSMPYVSSGCIELFEGAPEEFLAGIRDFRSLEHPDDRSGIDQAMHHSAQTLTPFKHEWRIITPSGTVKWVQAASRPERQADGSIIWDGVKLDISDRKRAEAELHHRTGELEQTLQELQSTQTQMIQAEKMSSLGQLVAGVAHEINNPVNFIYGNLSHADDYIQDVLGLLELYQQYSTPHPVIEAKAAAVDLDFLVEDLPKLLSSMRVGADRIQKIVASLRTFSRMDESEMKAVDIHQGIDSTLMILQHRLKARSDRSTIEVVKHYDSLPLVECYAGQLNQVFMNMLSNAIDAIEEELVNQSNSSTPTITIRTQLIKPNQVKIYIADSGAGMPEPIRKRLFKPFFTTKPVGKGTGMGLSISYQIVAEKHGGSLSCQSELGQGTEFIIQIPLQQQKSIKESVAV